MKEWLWGCSESWVWLYLLVGSFESLSLVLPIGLWSGCAAITILSSFGLGTLHLSLCCRNIAICISISRTFILIIFKMCNSLLQQIQILLICTVLLSISLCTVVLTALQFELDARFLRFRRRLLFGGLRLGRRCFNHSSRKFDLEWYMGVFE